MGTRPSRDFGGVRVDSSEWPIIVMEFHRPPTPNAFLATRAGGLLYAIELLEQANVALPSRVCELRDRLVVQSEQSR